MKLHAAALMAVVAVSARAGPAEAQEATVVVELFTSEGCSSCPPAEVVLARLLTRPPGGVRVIALEEHVDYWDELGWRDRFAQPAFTRRQEAYVRRMGLTGSYTPQLVVVGRSQVVGGDEAAARAAIASAARAPMGRAAVDVRGRDPAGYTLDVHAEWTGGPAEVVVLAVQDHARSAIGAGENAGRVLDHVAVARSLAVVGRGDGRFSGTVRVPRAGIEEADRVVVLVQGPDAGPVLAVATRELR